MVRVLQNGLFTGTILLSAFLLFWSQPLFAKMILPILGGSSSVWTTSMLFFQIALLAGYVYAHFLSRLLQMAWQVAVHLFLLGAAAISLPFYIDATSPVPPEGTPVLWLLARASVTVGPPFFLASATAPLLQRWFSRTNHIHRHNPYFLYAASNAGSMAALLSFPTLLEPAVGVRAQTLYWSAGYALLWLLFVATGLLTLKNGGKRVHTLPDMGVKRRGDQTEVTAGRRVTWVFAAFIPSSMMLGLTSHVTTDIAPVAMFWIVPLALYLLSFVIVFSRWQHLVDRRILAGWAVLCTFALCYMRFAGYEKAVTTTMVAVAVNLSLFFAAAWLFHGFLSSLRPAAEHLTGFYLWMSIGGTLGGCFNGLIAPLIFNQIYEYYVMVVVVFAISVQVLLNRSKRQGGGVPETGPMVVIFIILLVIFLATDLVMSRQVTVRTRQIVLLGGLVTMVSAVLAAFVRPDRYRRWVVWAVVLSVAGIVLVRPQSHTNILLARSFYGSLKVKIKEDLDDVPYHLFIHGSTRHNMQRFGPDLVDNQEPLMYFHRQANLGHAISALQAHLDRPLHFGLVGLGAGAMSAYLQVGDTATYYEIDPEVVAMAQNSKYFTYLAQAMGHIDIVVGDARLGLRRAIDRSYDVLLIDAFSSDAIPVHLLTAEAVAMYLAKIREDGMLLFHLSNRYLDLHRVLQGIQLPPGYVLHYASKDHVDRPAAPPPCHFRNLQPQPGRGHRPRGCLAGRDTLHAQMAAARP